MTETFKKAVPERVLAFVEAFGQTKTDPRSKEADLLPMGTEAMQGPVQTLLGTNRIQDHTRRALSFEDIFGLGGDLLGQET